MSLAEFVFEGSGPKIHRLNQQSACSHRIAAQTQRYPTGYLIDPRTCFAFFSINNLGDLRAEHLYPTPSVTSHHTCFASPANDSQ